MSLTETFALLAVIISLLVLLVDACLLYTSR